MTQIITCDGRNYDKVRVDENNYHIWRDVGLAIMKEPSSKLDVSTFCTNKD